MINFTLVYQPDLTNFKDFTIVPDPSTDFVLDVYFSFEDSGYDRDYVTENCSNSTCSALAGSIILEGKANDIINVSVIYESDSYIQSQDFSIRLRSCIAGEIYNEASEQCVYCQLGTYSLDPDDAACLDCPIGATCYGGTSITVQPGYYRSTANSSLLQLVPCNDSSTRCLGGQTQTNCSDVYKGIACDQCNLQNGYLSAGKEGGCTQCYDKDKLLAYAILILIGTLVYQVMMIMTTYKENKAAHYKSIMEKSIGNKQKSNRRRNAITIEIVASESKTDAKPISSPININKSSDRISTSRKQNNSPAKLLHLQHDDNDHESDIRSVLQNEKHKRLKEQKQREHREKKEKQEQESSSNLNPGAFTVIFTNFSQIASILANFNVGSATTILSVSIAVGNSSSEAIFSFQCVYRLVSTDLFDGLEFETILTVFSPLVKLVVIALIEMIRVGIMMMISKVKKHQDKKQKIPITIKATTTEEIAVASTSSSSSDPTPVDPKQPLLVRLGAAAVVLFLLEQPGIISQLCQCLTCSKLDHFSSDYYIQSRNNIQCYTDRYNYFIFTIVLPALIFWAFIIPLAIFSALYFRRKQLYHSLPLRIVLGNFYSPYAESTFYWGIVIMVFKMLIFIFDSVLPSSSMTKGLVFMMVFHIYFVLFKKRPPYDHKYLNLAEKYCSYAYMMILTLAMLEASVGSNMFANFCNVAIMACLIGAGGYMLVHIFWLYIIQVWQVIKKFKQQLKDKKVLRATLEALRVYHKVNPLVENPNPLASKRRFGICLDLPKRYTYLYYFEPKLTTLLNIYPA